MKIIFPGLTPKIHFIYFSFISFSTKPSKIKQNLNAFIKCILPLFWFFFILESINFNSKVGKVHRRYWLTKMFYKLSTTFAAAGLESNKITRKSFNDIFNSCSLYYQVTPESTFLHIFYNDSNKRILVVILLDKMLFNFDETF